MDGRVLDYLERKMSEDRRYDRRGDSQRDGYRDSRRDRRDAADERRRMRDKTDREDSRRRRDRRGDDDDERDMDDFRDSRRDYADGHNVPFELNKHDVKAWEKRLGEKHFDMQQIMRAAEKMDIDFEEYDEKEFCLTVNMLCDMFCEVTKKYISPDKEIHYCVEMAKEFLEGADGGAYGAEKLALYYHTIVNV